jgi:hypothetical protein
MFERRSWGLGRGKAKGFFFFFWRAGSRAGSFSGRVPSSKTPISALVIKVVKDN